MLLFGREYCVLSDFRWNIWIWQLIIWHWGHLHIWWCWLVLSLIITCDQGHGIPCACYHMFLKCCSPGFHMSSIFSKWKRFSCGKLDGVAGWRVSVAWLDGVGWEASNCHLQDWEYGNAGCAWYPRLCCHVWAGGVPCGQAEESILGWGGEARPGSC